MQTALRDFKTLDALSTEASNRPIRRRSLEVVDYKPTDPRPETHLALEGTITVLAAQPGSRLMAGIRKAVASRDYEQGELARRLYRQYRGRKPVALSRAVKIAVAQPVFADVLHGDMLLVENLFVPEDLEVAFVSFPYNGGHLATGGLTLVEHPRSEKIKPLDVLVLRHMPELTKAERAALVKVPAEQRALNVGSTLIPRACSVVLLTAAVVAEVAIVAVTYAITGKVDLEHMEHINPADLKKMGPSKSARVLVEKRRGFLKRKKKHS